MKHLSTITAITAILITATSCTPQKKGESAEPSEGLQYARYFEISEKEGYKEALVRNPWHEGDTLSLYYLVRDDSTATPAKGVRVKVPLESIALNSCSHAGFVSALGLTDKVVGMASPKYVYDEKIGERISDGRCRDIGDSFSMNFETIAMLRPGALMMTRYENSSNSRLDEAAAIIIDNVEWMEPDILGRAEWIKFVAAFFCAEDRADSIFGMVTARYDSLTRLCQGVENKPSILPGLPFKGTWYVPGGESYMARLFAAAGGSYRYAENGRGGSLPLSFETVLSEFSDCDFWLGAEAPSLEAIRQMDERLCYFKAYEEGRVYNNSKRSRPETGANDFWEGGVVRPDLLLEDLIKVLHPELMADDETYFIQLLK